MGAVGVAVPLTPPAGVKDTKQLAGLMQWTRCPKNNLKLNVTVMWRLKFIIPLDNVKLNDISSTVTQYVIVTVTYVTQYDIVTSLVQ